MVVVVALADNAVRLLTAGGALPGSAMHAGESVPGLGVLRAGVWVRDVLLLPHPYCKTVRGSGAALQHRAGGLEGGAGGGGAGQAQCPARGRGGLMYTSARSA